MRYSSVDSVTFYWPLGHLFGLQSHDPAKSHVCFRSELLHHYHATARTTWTPNEAVERSIVQ